MRFYCRIVLSFCIVFLFLLNPVSAVAQTASLNAAMAKNQAMAENQAITATKRRALIDASSIPLGTVLTQLPKEKTDYVVTLSGTAKGAEGRRIRWFVNEDPITNSEYTIDETYIDSAGHFELEGFFWQIMSTSIKIDYYDANLFVAPGTDYKIEFLPYDYRTDEKINVFFPSARIQPLTYNLLAPKNEELNNSIWNFLQLYATYIDQNAYDQILIYGQKKPLKDLLHCIDSIGSNLYPLRSDYETEFVKNYVRYKLAILEEFAGLKGSKALYNHYIKDQAINYRNPAQIEFLSSYFDSYFEVKSPIPQKALSNILASGNIKGVLDSLGVDSTLVNEQLREWVFITSLWQTMNKGVYSKTHLIKLIEQVKQNSKFPFHVVAAENVAKAEKKRQLLYRNFTGFLFRDEEGREVKTDTLLPKGLDGYVCFVKRQSLMCPSCSAEIEELRSAFKKEPELASKFRAIVIVCDDDTASFAAYVKAQKKYDTFLVDANKTAVSADLNGSGAIVGGSSPIRYYYFNRNVEAFKDWEIYSFPSFVLLDQKGRIYLNFKAPSKGGIKYWSK